MSLSTSKLSKYIGQATDDPKLGTHLVNIDRDLDNLWRIVNFIAPFVGVSTVVLKSDTALGYNYMPLVDPNPLGSPTNFTGHAAFAFVNSNSSLYIYNSSDTSWKVVALA